MNPSFHSDHDRLLELLADRALVGLDGDQQRELEVLLQASPGFDPDGLDRTAAILDITAAANDGEPLPERLRDRIFAQYGSDLQTRPDGPGEPSYESQPFAPVPRTKVRWREVAAWLVAAACLLFAVLVHYIRPPSNQSPPTIAGSEMPASPLGVDKPTTGTTTLTLAQQREQLLASSPDVMHLQLVSDNGGGVANETGGDVVWSSGRQIGFLRLRGLASNAPAQRQYKLWIVGSDASGNEIIQGGIFPVDRSTGELILPIQAGQFVQQPKMFVVSVESPGGGKALTSPLLAKTDGVGL